MESFREYFNAYVERQYKAELSYEGTTSYLQMSLLDLRRFDIRIILGFFGPEEMRMVLCEVCTPLAVVVLTVHTHAHTHAHTHMYTHTHTCVHTPTPTHTHTHTGFF